MVITAARKRWQILNLRWIFWKNTRIQRFKVWLSSKLMDISKATQEQAIKLDPRPRDIQIVNPRHRAHVPHRGHRARSKR